VKHKTRAYQATLIKGYRDLIRRNICGSDTWEMNYGVGEMNFME